uniref:KaiC-like domain-containing protein n=1 Tax=Tanacetum cinerariifolium TaxID=118510 RepID=A0A699GEP9_TANCI|nr:hypothetical protein [Tanacetum cinerariifolium]
MSKQPHDHATRPRLTTLVTVGVSGSALATAVVADARRPQPGRAKGGQRRPAFERAAATARRRFARRGAHGAGKPAKSVARLCLDRPGRPRRPRDCRHPEPARRRGRERPAMVHGRAQRFICGRLPPCRPAGPETARQRRPVALHRCGRPRDGRRWRPARRAVRAHELGLGAAPDAQRAGARPTGGRGRDLRGAAGRPGAARPPGHGRTTGAAEQPGPVARRRLGRGARNLARRPRIPERLCTHRPDRRRRQPGLVGDRAPARVRGAGRRPRARTPDPAAGRHRRPGAGCGGSAGRAPAVGRAGAPGAHRAATPGHAARAERTAGVDGCRPHPRNRPQGAATGARAGPGTEHAIAAARARGRTARHPRQCTRRVHRARPWRRGAGLEPPGRTTDRLDPRRGHRPAAGRHGAAAAAAPRVRTRHATAGRTGARRRSVAEPPGGADAAQPQWRGVAGRSVAGVRAALERPRVHRLPARYQRAPEHDRVAAGPGAARHPHRPAQPARADAGAAGRPAAGAAFEQAVRRVLPRPRPLQAGQRPLRPRGRRRAAAPVCRPRARRRAQDRHRGPPGRRRIHRHRRNAGQRRRRPRRCGQAGAAAAPAVHAQDHHRHAQRQHRRGRAPPRRSAGYRNATGPGGPRHVCRQGTRPPAGAPAPGAALIRAVISTPSSPVAQQPALSSLSDRPMEPQNSNTSDFLSSGVPGLDNVLAGGLTADRLYLVEGEPGTGKTTLALQFLIEGTRRAVHDLPSVRNRTGRHHPAHRVRHRQVPAAPGGARFAVRAAAAGRKSAALPAPGAGAQAVPGQPLVHDHPARRPYRAVHRPASAQRGARRAHAGAGRSGLWRRAAPHPGRQISRHRLPRRRARLPDRARRPARVSTPGGGRHARAQRAPPALERHAVARPADGRRPRRRHEHADFRAVRHRQIVAGRAVRVCGGPARRKERHVPVRGSTQQPAQPLRKYRPRPGRCGGQRPAHDPAGGPGRTGAGPAQPRGGAGRRARRQGAVRRWTPATSPTTSSCCATSKPKAKCGRRFPCSRNGAAPTSARSAASKWERTASGWVRCCATSTASSPVCPPTTPTPLLRSTPPPPPEDHGKPHPDLRAHRPGRAAGVARAVARPPRQPRVRHAGRTGRAAGPGSGRGADRGRSADAGRLQAAARPRGAPAGLVRPADPAADAPWRRLAHGAQGRGRPGQPEPARTPGAHAHPDHGAAGNAAGAPQAVSSQAAYAAGGRPAGRGAHHQRQDQAANPAGVAAGGDESRQRAVHAIGQRQAHPRGMAAAAGRGDAQRRLRAPGANLRQHFVQRRQVHAARRQRGGARHRQRQDAHGDLARQRHRAGAGSALAHLHHVRAERHGERPVHQRPRYRSQPGAPVCRNARRLGAGVQRWRGTGQRIRDPPAHRQRGGPGRRRRPARPVSAAARPGGRGRQAHAGAGGGRQRRRRRFAGGAAGSRGVRCARRVRRRRRRGSRGRRRRRRAGHDHHGPGHARHGRLRGCAPDPATAGRRKNPADRPHRLGPDRRPPPHQRGGGMGPSRAPRRLAARGEPWQAGKSGVASLLPVAPQYRHLRLQAVRRHILRRHRFAHRQRQARAQAVAERALELVFLVPAEQMRPQSAQRHRDHRHLGPLDDLGNAALERIDLAGARQLPLGENAYQLALVQRLGDIDVRFFHQPWIFLGRRDGNGARGAEDPAQKRRLENPVVHHEPDRARADGADHQRIDVADVVTYQHGRAFGGNAAGVHRVHAVHGVNQQPGQEAHQEFRHQREDVDGHHGIEQRRHQEQLGDAQALAQQHDGRAGRRHHEQRVEDVHAGNGARQVGGIGAQLDQREQRHDEKAAEHADHQKVEQDAPHARLRHQRERIDRRAGHAGDTRRRTCAAGGKGIAGEIQVGAKHGQADRAERHQADFHLGARQPLAQQRARAHTQRKHGEQQHEHAVVAMQVVLGKHGQLRQQHGAVKPEPGIAQHRLEHHPVFAGKAQVAQRLGSEIPADLELGRGGRRHGNAVAGQQADHGHKNGGARLEQQAVRLLHDQHGAEDFAGQDADKRPHFGHAVTADQLFLFQVLRQVRVFDRSEQRGMDAHAHHGRHQQPQVMGDPADAGHGHDRHLEPFDAAGQSRLVELVGQLAGSGGEQHVGQDEQAGDQVGDQRRRQVGPADGIERDDHDQRGLEQVVVEGAQELGPEKRREAALLQQGKLVGLAHVARVRSRGAATAPVSSGTASQRRNRERTSAAGHRRCRGAARYRHSAASAATSAQFRIAIISMLAMRFTPSASKSRTYRKHAAREASGAAPGGGGNGAPGAVDRSSRSSVRKKKGRVPVTEPGLWRIARSGSALFIGRHFVLAQLGGQLVQHAVDVLVAVDTAKRLGQLDRFVDDHAVRDFQVVFQFVRADQQHRVLDRRQLLDAAVDQRRERLAQGHGILDRAVQQLGEMLGVGLVEAVRGADVVDDRGGGFVVQQPLVQALQRELACAVTRGAVFAGVGV